MEGELIGSEDMAHLCSLPREQQTECDGGDTVCLTTTPRHSASTTAASTPKCTVNNKKKKWGSVKSETRVSRHEPIAGGWGWGTPCCAQRGSLFRGEELSPETIRAEVVRYEYSKSNSAPQVYASGPSVVRGGEVIDLEGSGKALPPKGMWKLRSDVLSRKNNDTRPPSGYGSTNEPPSSNSCEICVNEFNMLHNKLRRTVCCDKPICSKCTNRIIQQGAEYQPNDERKRCPFCRVPGPLQVHTIISPEALCPSLQWKH